jgi:hypothetical protein
MSHEVLISYSRHDKLQADAICNRLEAKGIRCWIAPRDVPVGTEYADSIVQAIESSQVLLLVFSANADQSKQVKREVERAVSAGIKIMPVRIEDTAMSKSFEYYVGSIHWLDAITPPLESHIDRLVHDLQALLPNDRESQLADSATISEPVADDTGAKEPPASTAPQPPPSSRPPSPPEPEAHARPSRLPLFVAAAAVIGAAAVALFVLDFGPSPSDQDDDESVASYEVIADDPRSLEPAVDVPARYSSTTGAQLLDALVDECQRQSAWVWSCDVPAIPEIEPFLDGPCACEGRILRHIETGLYRCEALSAACGGVSFVETLGYEPEMAWYEDVTPF